MSPACGPVALGHQEPQAQAVEAHRHGGRHAAGGEGRYEAEEPRAAAAVGGEAAEVSLEGAMEAAEREAAGDAVEQPEIGLKGDRLCKPRKVYK